MSNGLARAAVRFRPASFAGSFIALLFAAAIITACGTLLQTGVTARLAPERYARTPVVVAGDPYARISVKHDRSTEEKETALPERARVDAGSAARIAALPGVAAAVPDLAFPVQSPAVPTLTGRGYASIGFTAPTAGELVEGRAPGAGEVVLDEATAQTAKLRTGDRVELITPAGTDTYRVCGLADARAGRGSAWFADTVADRLAGHPGRVDAIAVTPREGVPVNELASKVRETVGESAKVFTGDDRATVERPGLLQAQQILIGLGGSFGGTATLAAVFVVMSTIALATGQRAREFALLRAIGATSRQIRRTIATEALLIAPLAAALGAVPGIALARWWFDQLVARGAVPEGVALEAGPLPVLVAAVLSLLAALAAGRLAARRPARLRPGQALGEAAVERVRPGKARTVIGLVAAAGGLVLTGVANNLNGAGAANTALGMVMCFLLAVALLGPYVAQVCTGLLGLPLRSGRAGASGSLAADNTRAHARRLASAIIPIVMVVAFCGTLLLLQGTVRHVSGEQVRDGIVADQVLGSAGAGLPADTVEHAARVPGVATAIGVVRTGVVHSSGQDLASSTALGVSGDLTRLPEVLDLGVRSGSLGALAESADTVALSAALADSLHAKVGDRVPLRLGDGTQVRPKVVATYERGLGFGQVVLPRAAVAGHVNAAFDSHVLVSDAPGAERVQVAERLAKLAAPGLTVMNAAGFAAQEDRDQQVTSWANTVMAAVLGGFAAVAAVNTLVMTVLDRRREVGLLRLAGATRRQVRDMMRWEALLVAATGLTVGGGIAWLTLVPITRGVTGAAPHVPLTTVLSLAAATILLSLAATALPTRELLRTHPVRVAADRQ
ncbi:ABC transporter permease [Kitasatospora sp. NPDC059673]|uniref:ABC transporter permease n=1 Tax=Kitasatospora sp. NPDC059673 TaxID=3346901 RepID=UPI0036BFA297